MQLRLAGGLAALVAALTGIAGFLLLQFVLLRGGYDNPQVALLAMLATNKEALYIRYMVENVLLGLVLIVFVVALDVRLRPVSPGLSRVALLLAVIWANLLVITGVTASVMPALVLEQATINREFAIDLHNALSGILSGLAIGDVILGGLWLALTSYAALRADLPRPLCYLGMAVGVAGLCPLLPPLSDLGSTLFAIGSIPWFIGLGLVLLGRDPMPVHGNAVAQRQRLASPSTGFSEKRMRAE